MGIPCSRPDSMWSVLVLFWETNNKTGVHFGTKEHFWQKNNAIFVFVFVLFYFHPIGPSRLKLKILQAGAAWARSPSSIELVPAVLLAYVAPVHNLAIYHEYYVFPQILSSADCRSRSVWTAFATPNNLRWSHLLNEVWSYSLPFSFRLFSLRLHAAVDQVGCRFLRVSVDYFCHFQ